MTPPRKMLRIFRGSGLSLRFAPEESLREAEL